MTHFFLTELSSSLHLSPNLWWVRCSLVFLFLCSPPFRSLCCYVLPRPNFVLIITYLHLFRLLFVPYPKSSSIALTLILPLVHAPHLCVWLSSRREMHTVSIWHQRFFSGSYAALNKSDDRSRLSWPEPGEYHPNQWTANQLPQARISVLPPLLPPSTFLLWR